ncbi:branched-chain amino acid ABC transporter permease [Thermobispora bispora]|uniref:Inner-membrane translocator n=1 Tax=Thermobispora bispora (strain ATCC 19993 / DSM 43833 / CBS 139.67 / JCM 10125 / KCTC 9307 / NBRC 14880 / R51) TaxID=469371 RepID=D6Y494_THEBD|nr:branched-chain amino acid ABC transporter permease [Thermobispora bispora]MBO2475888.1 branched-chain amino acid ABC transporter permease [Actinomycetales bacterium]MDI9581578.1 branched-chain amino acid ABC transporter permease [Thermobispora sp.]ADG87148.1 inner-membrane translocator [Thermobispora bispora DSM 43833]MBX6167707.1 branched-chain amino acid ABC transporter permease [Thermobispora bispora]QSI47113.1 branched-chain amino acid ABC transporter permease [Thermobispora bispora]
MSTFILLTVTGLGLAALYFLVASGLSLIYGLMDVLNFAHGAFLTLGAYTAWVVVDATGSLLLGVAVAIAVGAVLAVLMETALLRRMYGSHVPQVLLTVGLLLAITALIRSIFGTDALQLATPEWMNEVTEILGAPIPNNRFVLIVTAVLVYLAMSAFLAKTRYGLIIRAGVENRAMVTALGIDVRRAFTLVFAIGGALAALAGALAGVINNAVSPEQGMSLLIFAFIVVIIGGLGSFRGSALAAVLVGLLQQYANFYGAVGAGDLIVVLMLAAILLVRPQGLLGRAAS